MDREKASREVTRRETLKSIAVGSIGANFLGQSRQSHRNKVKIPIVKKGDEVVHSKVVPKKWRAHENHVKNLQKELLRRYSDDSAIWNVTIGRGDANITSDRKESSLVVKVLEGEEPESDLPNSLEGVQVEVKEKKDPVPKDCYTSSYDPLPGGVAVYADENEDSGQGSLACPVKDSNGNRHVMTASHLFYGTSTSECSDIAAEPLDQNTQHVGTVSDYNHSQDWAIVQQNSNSDLTYGFEDSIVQAYGNIAGHVDETGLEDMKSTGELAYFRGRRSCDDKSGTILELGDKVKMCSTVYADYDYLRIDHYTYGGDSGGVHFKKTTVSGEQDLAIIAPHMGEPDGNDKAGGCAAYKINNNHGITFGL